MHSDSKQQLMSYFGIIKNNNETRNTSQFFFLHLHSKHLVLYFGKLATNNETRNTLQNYNRFTLMQIYSVSMVRKNIPVQLMDTSNSHLLIGHIAGRVRLFDL